MDWQCQLAARKPFASVWLAQCMLIVRLTPLTKKTWRRLQRLFINCTRRFQMDRQQKLWRISTISTLLRTSKRYYWRQTYDRTCDFPINDLPEFYYFEYSCRQAT